MRIHQIGFRIRGFYHLAQTGHRWDMIPKDSQHRFNILQFFARHGLAATAEAFGVSRHRRVCASTPTSSPIGGPILAPRK